MLCYCYVMQKRTRTRAAELEVESFTGMMMIDTGIDEHGPPESFTQWDIHCRVGRE